jgi:hypothetical protein
VSDVTSNPVGLIAEYINELIDAAELPAVVDIKPEQIVVDVQVTPSVVQVIANPTSININLSSSGGGSNNTQYQLLSFTNGQTIFTLLAAPLIPNISLLTLNGVKQQFGVDYIINGNYLTWLNIHALKFNDILEIYYN